MDSSAQRSVPSYPLSFETTRGTSRKLARLRDLPGMSTGRLLSQLPGLRLAVPETELAWQRDTRIRGLVACPVGWDVNR